MYYNLFVLRVCDSFPLDYKLHVTAENGACLTAWNFCGACTVPGLEEQPDLEKRCVEKWSVLLWMVSASTSGISEYKHLILWMRIKARNTKK